MPSVKPVNINDASEPETSLLMAQKEQLGQKHTGNGALDGPHAELQAGEHLLTFPPAAMHPSEDKLEPRSGAVTKWCFRDGHAAMPALGNQPLGPQVGYLEDSVQGKQTKCLGTFLLETRSWGADLSYHCMAPSPGQQSGNTPAAHMGSP